jgi:hypothetical protein
MAAAGTGGTLAVAALVMAAFTVFSSGGTDDVIADDPEPTVATTTTTVASDPDAMTMDLKPGPPVLVEFADPLQPVGEGTQQCLEVMVFPKGSSAEAIATHEGWACKQGTGEGAVRVKLRSTATGEPDGVQIVPGPSEPVSIGGCAQAVDRPNPAALASDRTEPGSTTFTLGDLPPGEHRLELNATSGIGDGCGQGPLPPDQERERSLPETLTVNVPGSD